MHIDEEPILYAQAQTRLDTPLPTRCELHPTNLIVCCRKVHSLQTHTGSKKRIYRWQLIRCLWSLHAQCNAYAACHLVTKATSTEGGMACHCRYLISQHPDADRKIAEELDSLDLLVTRTRRAPRQLQYADLSRMPYLSGAIRVGRNRADARF